MRLATAIQKEQQETRVRVFLMADSVTCALRRQHTPDGYYNIGRILRRVLHKEGQVALCGSCMDAGGVEEAACLEGTRRSTMSELAKWRLEAEKVLIF